MGKIAEEFKLFFTVVSVRGVPRIFTSNVIIISAFWLVTVIIFFGIFIWQIVLLMSSFFSYPYSTTTKEDNSYPIFPSLSICNLNPILLVTSNYTSVLSWPQHLINVQNALKNTNYSIANKAFGNVSSDDSMMYIRDLESPGGYFSNFPIEKPSKETQNDMILQYGALDWNWMRSNVTATITPYFDPSYFYCYSLTVDSSDAKKVQMMSLVVYINNFPEYLLPGIYQLGNTESKAEGASLRIHYPGTRGNMKQGINLSPGTESTFYIEMINRNRLNYPYNKWKCTNEDPSNETGFMYNINDCIELCLQQLIVDNCKCVSINHVFKDTQLVQAKHMLCGNMSNFGNEATEFNGPGQSTDYYAKRSNIYPDFLKQLACMNDFKTNKNEYCLSKCLLPCNETTYRYTGMTAEWPEVTNHLPLYRKYIVNPISRFIDKSKFIEYEKLDNLTVNNYRNDKDIIEKLKTMTLIKENFLQINVIFQSRYSHLIQDKESFTSQSMLSSIGGCFSLWLGLSFMTIAEVVEFFIRLVRATAKIPLEVKPTLTGTRADGNNMALAEKQIRIYGGHFCYKIS